MKEKVLKDTRRQKKEKRKQQKEEFNEIYD